MHLMAVLYLYEERKGSMTKYAIGELNDSPTTRYLVINKKPYSPLDLS